MAFAVNPLVCVPLQARLGDAAFWPLMTVVVVPAIFILLGLDRSADLPHRLRGRSEPALGAGTVVPG